MAFFKILTIKIPLIYELPSACKWRWKNIVTKECTTKDLALRNTEENGHEHDQRRNKSCISVLLHLAKKKSPLKTSNETRNSNCISCRSYCRGTANSNLIAWMCMCIIWPIHISDFMDRQLRKTCAINSVHVFETSKILVIREILNCILIQYGLYLITYKL